MPKLTELPMLRVGLIGSGFIAAFHLQSMVGVRNISIGGVYSRSAERRKSAKVQLLTSCTQWVFPRRFGGPSFLQETSFLVAFAHFDGESH